MQSIFQLIDRWTNFSLSSLINAAGMKRQVETFFGWNLNLRT